MTAKIVSKSESEFAAAERKHKRNQAKILSKSESELAAAEIDHKRKQAKIISKSESELAAAERKHKRKERKLTQKMAATEIEHKQLLISKDRKHSKLQVPKKEKYSELIAEKDEKHSELVSGLHLKNHNLKRDYNAVLGDIKIKHRSSLQKQHMLHAQHIDRKNTIAKKMLHDVEDTCEMLWEIFNKINESKRTIRMASTSANKAAVSAERAIGKSPMLLNKLKESTNLLNELKDEINNDKKIISDMQ